MFIFLKRILIYFVPIILFFVFSICLFLIKKNEYDLIFKKDSKYSNLILGDSQMQRIRTSDFKESTFNFSSSAEHYFFTYQKCLAILNQKNVKVKRIILGVSIHNFAPTFNRCFDVNFPEGQSSLKRYLYFVQDYTDSYFYENFAKKIKPIVKSVFVSSDLGGFKESSYKNPTDQIIQKVYNNHYRLSKSEKKFCYSQRYYLYKIDSLCLRKGVELILISTPYHSKYKAMVDQSYFTFFYNSMKPLSYRKHINFINDKVDPNLMSDANHLNVLGAKIYSRKIQIMLDSI